MAAFKDKIKGFAGELSMLFDSKNGDLILKIAIVILINVVGAFLYFRADLTLNNSYSLSPVSRQTVKSLQEPLTVKVFFTKDLPAPYNSVYRYLSDILEEYDNAGGSNFHYEFVNVEDEPGKQAAASYGVNPSQVREIASDQYKARSAYMGLVIIHGDLVEHMNEITTPEGLEYKLTTTIRKMQGKTDALLATKSPIKVTLYVSNDLRNFGIQGFDKIEPTVKSAFDKVNGTNYRKLEYSLVDPSANKSSEEISKKYGIQKLVWSAATLPNGKSVSAGEGLLGIVIEKGDKSFVVPIRIQQSPFGNMIGGLENVDERINNAVSSVLANNPVIGYVAGHGEHNLNDEREGAANLNKVLSDMYNVKEVDLTKDDVAENIRTLIINGPKKAFTDEELYKVDQFIMKGGNVFFLIDSFSEIRNPNDPYSQAAYLPVDSGLSRILSSMGVSVGKDYVLDKKCYVQRSQQGNDMPLYFVPVIENNSLDGKNVITKFMKKLIFVQASSLTLDANTIKNNNLSSRVLVSSSDQSWKMEGRINLNPMMIAPPANDKGLAKYNLAVLVEGKFKSIFDGKKPLPADPKKAAQAKPEAVLSEGLKESAKKGSIVILGNSAITLPNILDSEGKSPDAAFIHNVIDYMNGTTDMQEMRSKGVSFNPLDTTKDLTRYLVKGVNIILVPLLGVLAGLIMWRRRIVRKKKIQAQFSKGVANDQEN